MPLMKHTNRGITHNNERQCTSKQCVPLVSEGLSAEKHQLRKFTKEF